MRSWRSSKSEPTPEPTPPDRGAGEAVGSGLYARSIPKEFEYRPIRIRTVQLAFVPVVVGMILLVVVPAVVVDLTPRGGATEGAGRGGDVERIDPDRGQHTALPPTPERGAEGIMVSSEHSLQARIAAARELGRSKTARALQALLEAAKSVDPATRRAAAMGLTRRLHDTRANDALWELLADQDLLVARSTATALGAVEGSSPLLVGRLDAPDLTGAVHVACLRALPYTGSPQSVPTLMRFVGEQGELGEAAKHTIWKICQRTQTELPPDFPEWRPRR